MYQTMNTNEDAKQLSLAETHKLASTIDTIELTGLQIAIISNCIAGALAHPEMLPEELRTDEGYMKSTDDVYDYIARKVESVIGRTIE